MKRYLLQMLITLFCLGSFTNTGFAQRPNYEKYGRIAITVVKEDFPGDEIKEYQYLGRKNISESKVEDSFSFQVQENNQKFNVTVKVTHDIKTNKLLTISVDSK
jgi:hypothetical protein